MRLLRLLAALLMSASAHAATYVYVSNAEDGDIGMYTLQPDGTLKPGQRTKAAAMVMPMTVSPDKRFLVAAARSKPFSAYSYAIDRRTGALSLIGTGPLSESFPYVVFDKTGRYVLSASYGANRFVFVPHLGTDQVFQFLFDEKTGRLTANTPPVLQLKAGTGPRHIVTSPDNRYVYVLNELTATVSILLQEGGRLREIGSASALPAESKLVPGAPRPTPGRDVSNDIRSEEHTSELQSPT